MITETEQLTSDIDWFFTNGKHIGFVASGGGKLPKSVSDRDVQSIISLSGSILRLPVSSEVLINKYVRTLGLNVTGLDQYLFSFTRFAEKGIFAFDRRTYNSFEYSDYRLITKPATPLLLATLNPEMVSAISLTNYLGEIADGIDISLIK